MTQIDGVTVEEGSGNVYANLGFPDAEEMLAKAELVREIGQIIKRRRLTPQRAAEQLGIPQSMLAGMLRGQFQEISQAKIIECLNRLGRDMDIPTPS
jgi:predicted XRE-type DNA-binding protein